MTKELKYLSAISSSSNHLPSINYNQKEFLYRLVLGYGIDVLNADRASFFIYAKEEHYLYNRITLYRHPEIKAAVDGSSQLTFTKIFLENDSRSQVIEKQFSCFFNNIGHSDFNLKIDAILGIKTTHLIMCPLFFQNDFVGLIEMSRQDPAQPFDSLDSIFFESITSITQALISNMFLYEWVIRDSLTSSYAINYFNKIIDNHIAIFKRHPEKSEPFSLFLMDIDNFKMINDTYGHYIGDQVIIRFADAINNFVRKDIDYLARYGGDEFTLLIAHCPYENAYIVAERILAYLKKNPIKIEGNNINFSISIGIAQYNIHGSDRKTLFINADKALYQAKRSGKNRYTIYHEH